MKTNLKSKSGYVFSKTYPDSIKLSQLQFVENITEELNFLVNFQIIMKKTPTLSMIQHILEVRSIDSGNGELHKERTVIDYNFWPYSNLLITKTKNSEVVAIAQMNGRFHLFKIPSNLEENNP